MFPACFCHECSKFSLVYDDVFHCRHFTVDPKSEEDKAKLFSVPDFVGDLTKAIASRVRGAVAGVRFDDFHKVMCPS